MSVLVTEQRFYVYYGEGQWGVNPSPLGGGGISMPGISMSGICRGGGGGEATVGAASLSDCGGRNEVASLKAFIEPREAVSAVL